MKRFKKQQLNTHTQYHKKICQKTELCQDFWNLFSSLLLTQHNLRNSSLRKSLLTSVLPSIFFHYIHENLSTGRSTDSGQDWETFYKLDMTQSGSSFNQIIHSHKQISQLNSPTYQGKHSMLDFLFWVPATEVRKAMGRQGFDRAFCKNQAARNPKSLIY